MYTTLNLVYLWWVDQRISLYTLFPVFREIRKKLIHSTIFNLKNGHDDYDVISGNVVAIKLTKPGWSSWVSP